jgi:hypothetical protein
VKRFCLDSRGFTQQFTQYQLEPKGDTMANTSKRGFASMDSAKQREIALTCQPSAAKAVTVAEPAPALNSHPIPPIRPAASAISRSCSRPTKNAADSKPPVVEAIEVWARSIASAANRAENIEHVPADGRHRSS